MPRLAITEYQYASTTDEVRKQIHAMMQEYSQNSGIDWQFEYRWADFLEEDYLLALLKYQSLLANFKVI